MDYFKAEEFRKETKKGVIELTAGVLGIGLFIYSIVIVVLTVLGESTGVDTEGLNWVVTTLSVVVVTGVSLMLIREYKYGDSDGYEYLGRVKRLEARKKKNKIMKGFDKSRKYRRYVETTSIEDVEGFIEEMVKIRNNIEGFIKYVGDSDKKDFYETFVWVIVEPNYFNRYKGELGEGLKYIHVIKEYEELKEEVKKEVKKISIG